MRTPYSSWKISLLTVISLLLHTSRRVRATTTDFYNVCLLSNDDIQAGQGYGVIGYGDDETSRPQCQRVVVADEAFFIEFKVLDGAASHSGHRIEIYDGGYESSKSQRRHVFEADTMFSGFNVTGNVALVRFISGDEFGPRLNVSFCTHRVSVETPACPCPVVHDGRIDCTNNDTSEGQSLKNCKLSCDADYKNPALPKGSSGYIQCNLNANKWKEVDRTPLKHEYWCINRTAPSGLQKILRFRYMDATCQNLTNQSLEVIKTEIVRYMVQNATMVKLYGECFVSEENPPACSIQRIKVICKSNESNPSSGLEIIEVTVQDKPKTARDVWSNVENLASAFYRLNLGKLGRMERFDVKQNGNTYKVEKATIHEIPYVDCLCPKGLNKFCALSTHHCAACPKNTYYNPRLQKCSDCIKGQIQDPSDSEKCIPGLRNFTLQSLHSCSTTCPPGKGFSYETGLCHWCAKDSYADSTSTDKPQCLTCPDGKVTPFIGVKNLSDCILPCGVGEYVELDHDNFIACTKCPKGYYMDRRDHTIQFCKPCPRNFTTSQNGSTDQTQCIEKCPVGHHYSAADSSCLTCPQDTFQDEEGSTTCKNCPASHGTLTPGGVKAGDCRRYCGAGEFYNQQRGQGACSACPKSSYMEETQHLKTTCSPCPDSKTTTDSGSKSVSECGYYCPIGNYFDKDAKECKKCKIGFYQNQPDQTQCLACGQGETTRRVGATSEDDCVQACGLGTFLNPTSTSCTPCPVGTYQEREFHTMAECDKCPSNTTTPEKGTKYASSCVQFCDLEIEPCMYNTQCVNKENDFSCKCRKGLDGKKCEIIVDKDKTQSVSVSIQFTGLEWDVKLEEKESDKYKTTVKMITSSITEELKDDSKFKVVTVKKLSQGSVIAVSEIVYVPDKNLHSPAQTLYSKIMKTGKVGSIEVNSSSVRVVSQSCKAPLGMESGAIENFQITGTQGVEGRPPYEARLNTGKGWHAAEGVENYFLQVNFDERMKMTGIQTQGQASDSFVTSFELEFSDDGVSWKKYTEGGAGKVFDGNSDTIQTITLASPIKAQRIKLLPLKWKGCVCMRIELLGCRPDDSLLQLSTPSPTKPSTSRGTINVTTNAPLFLKPTRNRSAEMLSVVLAGIGAFLIVVLCSVVCYCFQTRQIGRSKGHHQMHKMQETTDLEGADGTTYTPLDPKNDEAETVI